MGTFVHLPPVSHTGLSSLYATLLPSLYLSPIPPSITPMFFPLLFSLLFLLFLHNPSPPQRIGLRVVPLPPEEAEIPKQKLDHKNEPFVILINSIKSVIWAVIEQTFFGRISP